MTSTANFRLAPPPQHIAFMEKDDQGNVGWRPNPVMEQWITQLFNWTTNIGNNATSSIGGFQIGADYIRDVANSFGLASTVTGGDDVRFWAGATFANRATAPARITEAGVATFSSGTVGGWTMGTTTLTGGNALLSNTGVIQLGTSNDVAILTAADANYRLWIGNASVGSAAFSVTKGGAMTCTSGTFSGSITGATGDFAGNINTSGWLNATGGTTGGLGTATITAYPSAANTHAGDFKASGTGHAGIFQATGSGDGLHVLTSSGTGYAATFVGNTTTDAILINAGVGKLAINAQGGIQLSGLTFSSDNTYDIGTNSTTARPRDLFVGRNTLIGGTLGITGVVTTSNLTANRAVSTNGSSQLVSNNAYLTSVATYTPISTTITAYLHVTLPDGTSSVGIPLVAYP